MQHTNDSGYKDWQRLALTAEEQSYVAQLKKYFNTVACKALASPLELDVEKACLTISEEEARTGACHPYEDGQPFFEFTLREQNEPGQRKVLLTLMHHFAVTLKTPGGCSLSSGKDGWSFSMSHRSLNGPGETLLHVTPQAIRLAQKP